MNVFGRYADYYDLLYEDKNYREESNFVSDLIKAHTGSAKHILDLGCGTGAHDLVFAELGYDVTGLDASAEMLRHANQLRASMPGEISERTQFIKGDVRSFNLGRKYDAVVSLFHVMSYQLTNDDLMAVFNCVKKHLVPDGVFIFDCWYGPAVLTDKPLVSVKRVSSNSKTVLRIAEPSLHFNENIVDINYHLFVQGFKEEKYEEIKEKHRIRYLFRPELELMTQASGLRIAAFGSWLADLEPDHTIRYVYFVVKHCDP